MAAALAEDAGGSCGREGDPMGDTVATTAAGTLRVEVSDQNGMGEDTMGEFVREHLASILRPFADHLDQLHRSVASLGDRLQETALVANDNTAELGNQARLATGFRRDLARLGQQLEDAHGGLEALRGDRDALRGDLDGARAELRALELEHRGTADAVTASQQEIKGASLRIDRLNGLCMDIGPICEKKVAALGDVLRQERREELETSRKAAEALAQGLADSRREAQEGLQKLKELMERRGREDRKRLDQLESAANRLDVLAKNNKEHIESQGVRSDAIKKTLSECQSRVDQALKAQAALEGRQSNTSSDVKDIKMRLEQTAASVKMLVENLGLTEGAKMGSIYDNIRELKDSTRQAHKGIEVVETKLRGQSARLTSEAQRTDLLERGLGEAREMLQRDDERIRALQAAVNQSEEEDRLEAERKEAQLAAERKAVADRLGALEGGLASAGGQIQRQREDLDAATARVRGVEDSLSSTGEQVAKLGNSLDLTQEYWKGLAKGFRDTHRTVAVDNTLLPTPPPPPLGTRLGVDAPLLPALTPPPGSALAKKAGAYGLSGGFASAR